MKYQLMIVIVFIWVGCILAISFLEAWLKFRAPGVTLPIGLGIGRLVFAALNKLEWVFLCVMGLSYVLTKQNNSWEFFIPVLVVLGILLVQTFYLLPVLDSRAQLHIDQKIVPKSNLHVCFVGAEVLKITLLVVFGVKLLKNAAIR